MYVAMFAIISRMNFDDKAYTKTTDIYLTPH